MMGTAPAAVCHRHDVPFQAGPPAGMHDRRDPVDAGQIGSGQSLIEAVGQALRATGYPALGRIELEICGGVVVLWGRVPTYHQKQLAQAVAHRVKGVRAIANGIEVLCTR